MKSTFLTACGGGVFRVRFQVISNRRKRGYLKKLVKYMAEHDSGLED